MEEFEYSGTWWLPENPDVQISGTLKFHPTKGATLELIGSFKGLKELSSLSSSFQPNIILGVSCDGKLITLYRCNQDKYSENIFSAPRISESSFRVGMVFIRHHFEKEEDIIFDSLSINYSHLDEWIGITGFQLKSEYDSNDRLIKQQVSYSFPEKIEADLENFKISFDPLFNSDIKQMNPIKEVNLKQTNFIKVEPQKAMHFNDYQKEILYHIQNFLSLATGIAVSPLIITGKTEACKTELSDGVMYHNIDVFYKANILVDTPKNLNSFDMIFSFKDISNDFEKHLKNWFKSSEIFYLVYDLYFGTLYNSSMYLYHEFLSLIQALESYHRLKYLNKLSLRKRLKEILEECGDLVNSLLAFNEKFDGEKFIDDVVNTRNFLTHYDKNLEAKAKKGIELYKLTQYMKFILEICFLKELEMPVDTIKSLTSWKQRYQYLKRI